MKKILLVGLLPFFALFFSKLNAQHDHHEMKPVAADSVPKSMKMDTGHHSMSNHDHMMTHAFSRNLPMNRNGSGTSWLPDSSPMYMLMKGRKTMWMFHGNVFLRYTNTDVFNKGKKGDHQISAPNWFMVMMNKPVGKRGLLTARTMVSLDRLTEGGAGYPLLFQSGETWKNQPLVNRQHPHDLISELAVGYTYMVNKEIDLFGYIGYPGEPALSAPAFMHRVSSMNNPDAPLGHHWQDATHITFGVGTLGFRYKKWKAEGSIFTGREPDENRYDFDEAKFDSYSYRLSYNPSPNWALQISQGFIHSPEKNEPASDVTRTTASVLFSRPMSRSRQMDAAFVWGYNDKGINHREHSFLLENNYRFGKQAIFGRYEFVQKSGEELDIEAPGEHPLFNIHALSAGYNRRLFNIGFTEVTAGSQLTFNLPAKEIREYYGKFPVGFQVYLQWRPSLMK